MKTKAITGILSALFLASIMAFNVGPVQAITIDIAPDTLNVYNNNGNYIAAHIEPSIFFSDNFSDGVADGWTELSGAWSIVDDLGNYVYSGTATGDEQVTYALSAGTFDNFIFEVKVKAINNAGHYGIILREDGTGKHYGFYLNAYPTAEGKYYFGYWSGAYPYHPIVPWTDSGGAYTDANVWNTLKVVANGYEFQLYINGILVNTVTDTNHYAASGHVGCIIDQYQSTGQNSHFDDVIVTENFDVTTIDVGTVKLWHMMFSDDFEAETVGSEASKWTAVSGEWRVEYDEGNVYSVDRTLSPNVEAITVAGDVSWTDYTLEFKMKMADVATTCASGPIMRYVDAQNWYFFECYNEKIFIRPHVDGVDLGKDPIPGTILEGLEGFPKDGQWHKIKIEAEGVMFTISVNDDDISFEYKGLDHGKVGLTTWPGDHVLYDDVSIVGPGVSNAVSPSGKLTTTWGRLKK